MFLYVQFSILCFSYEGFGVCFHDFHFLSCRFISLCVMFYFSLPVHVFCPMVSFSVLFPLSVFPSPCVLVKPACVPQTSSWFFMSFSFVFHFLDLPAFDAIVSLHLDD